MFVFTKQAHKQFNQLDARIQNQIKQKLLILKQDPQLLQQNLKPIINMNPITHRVRIGAYRLLIHFDVDLQVYVVIKVAHRQAVYK